MSESYRYWKSVLARLDFKGASDRLPDNLRNAIQSHVETGDLHAMLVLGAEERITRLNEEFRAGRELALLETISTCFEYKLPVPDWAAQEFVSRHDRFANFDARTLEDAFGNRMSSGAQFIARKRYARQAPQVYLEVTKRSNAGESIGPALFERVGKEFAMSGPLVSKYFYDLRKDQPVLCAALEFGLDDKPISKNPTD